MRILDLFSGIGGFSLGFEWAGLGEPVAFVEIEPYAQKVLRKHWPEVPIYGDIRKFGAEEIREVGPIDLISGGFPCQDISQAGKQKGLGEEGARTRSGLFFEIIRIMELCRPRWVVLENVAGLLSRSEWMGAVLGSLAEIGYDAEWEIIRASDMGAPHKRARIWIVAYPNDVRFYEAARARTTEGALFQSSPREDKTRQSERSRNISGPYGNVANSERKRRRDRNVRWNGEQGNVNRQNESGRYYGRRTPSNAGREWWATEPDVGRVAHGISSRVDRLKCLGNAIVPQIAELIGRRIKDMEET